MPASPQDLPGIFGLFVLVFSDASHREPGDAFQTVRTARVDREGSARGSPTSRPLQELPDTQL